MITITTDQSPVEQEPIFSIDDVTYSMPSTVSAAVAVKFLDVNRNQGGEAAVSWLMEEVLGTEAYKALMACKTLKPADLKAVMKIVTDKALGVLEEASGN